MSLSIGADTLVLNKLEFVRLWTNNDNEVVRFDVEFSKDDHSRISDFTQGRQQELMDMKVNGILLTRATLISTLSSSVSSGPSADFSKLDLSVLQSLLVEGEVIRVPLSEDDSSGQGIVEAMEAIFK